MNLQLLLISIAVALSIGFASGWKVNTWKYEAERQIAEDASHNAMLIAAEELAKIEVKNVTLKQQIETKIIERTIYRDCKHEPDSLLLLNKALSGKPISDSELSRTSPIK